MSKFTFSIVSHGHGQLLTQLLADLATQQSLSDSIVIITLNIENDFFELPQRSELRFRIKKNSYPKGFGANHNQAFLECDTDWFIILNPDLKIPNKDTFCTMTNFASQLKHPAIIAPLIVDHEGQREDSIRSNLTPFSLLHRHIFGQKKCAELNMVTSESRSFFWIAGMCMLFDHKVYKKLRGFDEKFFLYCEDYDICARAYNSGIAVAIDTNSSVIHNARRSSRHSLRYFILHITALFKVWTSKAFWTIVLGKF